MFSCTLNMRQNDQMQITFEDHTAREIGDIITVGGFKGVISTESDQGGIYSYTAVPILDINEVILDPRQGIIVLREVLSELAQELGCTLDTTEISGYLPLTNNIYSSLMSAGPAPDVLSAITSPFALAWIIYWQDNLSKPTLKIIFTEAQNIPVHQDLLRLSDVYTHSSAAYISVVTTPDYTEATETVLGNGSTEFEPSTQEFTMPYLEGTSEPAATITITDDYGEEQTIPYDQWEILKREQAVTNIDWPQKAPATRWTAAQRLINHKIVEFSDSWPIYWFTTNGLKLELPPEGKVKILETTFDTAETPPTQQQAIAAYPKLTYIHAGKHDIWSWVGVWPEVDRYDARIMDEHYNTVTVWRGDKVNNNQDDWTE